MRTLTTLALVLTLAAACEVPWDADPSAAPDPTGPSRVYPADCRLEGPPAAPPALRTERVLTGLTVASPVQLLPSPDGTGRVFVVSQRGRIHVADGVTPDGGGTLWLDVGDRIDDGPNEAGLLSIAFHPRFADNGRVFLSYTRRGDGGLESVVTEMTSPDPASAPPDPATERVILALDQPYGNHNGGQIAFGPDGYLYVGFGDGGSGGDPLGSGQDLGTWLGAILRVDVDPAGPTAADPAAPYAVPDDNPFVDVAGAAPEIWAYGLRNPWRFSFDPETGDLWAGDVGQGSFEEIDRIVRGGNYGWNVMEGTSCYGADDCDREGLLLPVHEYDHSVGRSVTGGHVYRGSALPSLHGVYLFTDFYADRLWGLVPTDDRTFAHETLADLPDGFLVAALGRDADGEVYLLDWSGGGVHRLVRDDDAPPSGWPERLGETGCFADLPSRRFAEGVLSYDVNAPLWSDGAAKERGIALPPDTTIGYEADGPWDLPDGTALIKTFLWDGVPLETRFLVRDGAAWRKGTYRWDDDGADATLLLTGAVIDRGDGEPWEIPSRTQCNACHTAAAGDVLGLRTRQLNRAHDVFGTGRPLNQVEGLARVGYLADAPAAPAAELPRFPDPYDESAPVAPRARAWLDVNCSMCHRPGGGANATFDIRHDAPADAAAGWCDASPAQGDLGVADARIVAPGAPLRSVLWLRTATLDPADRMPPLASRVVDDRAVALLERWIAALPGCAAR